MERVRGPVVMMGNREAEGLGRGSVTNQEKKAWLQQYRQAGHDIGDLLRERERILSMMTKMTANYSGMPRSGGGDSGRMESCVDKLSELEAELSAKAVELVSFRKEIERRIDALDSSEQKRCLRLRYLEGMTWERVSLEMGYERMQVWRIHGRALENLHPEQDGIE